MQFPRFLKTLLDNTVGQITQGFVAKVLTFDGQTMRAKISPLLQKNGSDGLPVFALPIADVPVGYLPGWIRAPYQTGDLVWINVSSYDIEKPLLGGRASRDGKRFSAENCSVAYKIAGTNDVPPTPWATAGLVMGQPGAFLRFEATKVNLEGAEKLGAIIADLHTQLDNLLTQIGLLTVTCAAPGNPSSPPVNAAAFVTIQAAIAAIKTRFAALVDS